MSRSNYRHKHRTTPGGYPDCDKSQDGARVLGNRGAHDTGGAIHGTHIDNYSGEGAAVVTAWRLAGGNLENAKVKFLRY